MVSIVQTAGPSRSWRQEVLRGRFLAPKQNHCFLRLLSRHGSLVTGAPPRSLVPSTMNPDAPDSLGVIDTSASNESDGNSRTRDSALSCARIRAPVLSAFDASEMQRAPAVAASHFASAAPSAGHHCANASRHRTGPAQRTPWERSRAPNGAASPCASECLRWCGPRPRSRRTSTDRALRRLATLLWGSCYSMMSSCYSMRTAPLLRGHRVVSKRKVRVRPWAELACMCVAACPAL